jgi:hypothetical protein
MTKIHLHIEQLSLPGYSLAERRAFVAALERELASSVTGNATTPQSTHQPAVRVTTPDLQPQSVARTTVRGLKLGGKTSGGRP